MEERAVKIKKFEEDLSNLIISGKKDGLTIKLIFMGLVSDEDTTALIGAITTPPSEWQKKMSKLLKIGEVIHKKEDLDKFRMLFEVIMTAQVRTAPDSWFDFITQFINFTVTEAQEDDIEMSDLLEIFDHLSEFKKRLNLAESYVSKGMTTIKSILELAIDKNVSRS